MEGDKEPRVMAAVTPKIPRFYSRNPDLWFAMAESKFATAVPQITNDLTEFHYLVQALEEDTALKVKDLIVKPPKDAYEALKKRLLLSFKLTRQERASWILDYPELGEGKATRMADQLTNYLEDDGRDLLMQEIFLQHLPKQVAQSWKKMSPLLCISWQSEQIRSGRRESPTQAWWPESPT